MRGRLGESKQGAMQIEYKSHVIRTMEDEKIEDHRAVDHSQSHSVYTISVTTRAGRWLVTICSWPPWIKTKSSVFNPN